MPYDTDKVFKKAQAYLEEHEAEIKDIDDARYFLSEFMQQYNQDIRNNIKHEPETSDDYLELAQEANTKKETIKYLKKALELDKNNIDARLMLAEITTKDPFELLTKYQGIITQSEKLLKKSGIFDECKGDFWLAFETRPYMRARYNYIGELMHCGMYRRATNECKELLVLCKNDNLGVRYDLMHIYALLEDKDSADKLYKDYGENTTHFLLPYSILYYKLGDFKKATKLLKTLAMTNTNTKKFFKTVCSHNPKAINKLAMNFDPDFATVNSIEEFLAELYQYSFLIDLTHYYFEWGNQILNPKNNK